MASNLHLSATLRSALLDAINAVVGSGGKLKIYSNAHAQPTDVGTALGSQTLLATLTLGSAALAAASAGAAAFNTITGDTAADDTGVAAWFSITKSDGTTRVLEGTVGASAADLNFDNINFVAGQDIEISSATISFAA